MLIPEMAPYIYGEKFTRDGLPLYRIEQDLYNEAAQMVAEMEGASESLNSFEKPKYFYKSNPDIEYLVPPNAREEIFFALKNGYACEEVPAKCIYLLNKAYHAAYEIPNLIFKAISVEDFNVLCQQNYFNGVSLRDVIKSFICETYEPITYESPIKRHAKFAEIYVAETDMIVAVPLDIAERMSTKDAHNLHVTSKGVCLGDIPLRILGERYGAINSTYDLRACV